MEVAGTGEATPAPAHRNASSTRHQSTTTLRRFPVVAAIGYPPSGRRTKFHTIAVECAFCGLAHVHRGTESAPARGSYRAGCGAGVYWLATVVVPAQRRRSA